MYLVDIHNIDLSMLSLYSLPASIRNIIVHIDNNIQNELPIVGDRTANRKVKNSTPSQPAMIYGYYVYIYIVGVYMINR